MKGPSIPTAFERLLEPLPASLRIELLLAYKNEDIPHDENDSLYRLMVLLTLYARFYQDMAGEIRGIADHINRSQSNHLLMLGKNHDEQSLLSMQVTRDFKQLAAVIANLHQVMEEKPKSLRTQFESELTGLLKNTRTQCVSMLDDTKQCWDQLKIMKRDVTRLQWINIFAAGVLAGMAVRWLFTF